MVIRRTEILYNRTAQPKRPKRSNTKPSSSTSPKTKPVHTDKSRKRKAVEMSSSSSSDDEPLLTSPKKPKAGSRRPNGGAVSAKAPPAGEVAKAAVLPNTAVVKASEEDDVSSDDDDAPLTAKAKSKGTAQADPSDSEDAPLAKAASKPKAKRAPPKKAKEESDDDDVFRASTSKAKKAPKTPAKKTKVEPKEESQSPSKSSQSPSKAKAEKKAKAKKEEEEQEEIHKWWEQEALGDGTQKWSTLEHQGVLFPPPYESLPKAVKLYYDGESVNLSIEAEEVAGFFAAMLETDHAKDATFCKNFFTDFKAVLARHPPLDGTVISDFEKCDFTKMYNYFEEERTKKKALPAAAKKEAKAEKDKAEAKYVYCLLDGRKEKVGNFRAEPPGLFRGRGDHPRKGALKHRLSPGDITINIGKEAQIPVPNVPGTWGKVIHDDTVTWLAHWKENINGNAKYVFLAAGSSLKGQSDMQKFEKARELKNHIDRVRDDYNSKLTSRVTQERQMATALYFIDKLALRAGNEKGDDEADTVGCCSLRYEHVTLQPTDRLVFDFLGKDSIRYYKVVDVEPQVYKNIRIFKGDNKTEGDAIFDRVTTTSINKHLNSYMKGLTAKVFRTYNASITFQQQLEERTPKDGSMIEKLAAYNEANRMVAILCNHQKSVSKNHGASMEKMENQVSGIRLMFLLLTRLLTSCRSELSSTNAANLEYRKQENIAEDESDVDDEWIATFEDESREREIEKAKKKFEKDNEKKAAEGEEELKPDVLEDRIAKVNEEYDRLKTERGTDKVEIKGKKTEEQILAAIEKLDTRIKTEKFKMEDKEKGKEVSLGTSKINYLDPRITTAWCKKYNVPIEKLFSKTLMVKFPWAMEVEDSWVF
ncbi:hypothetical protein BS47DRAFT_1445884 [Hydnum rufescens UP504]|uniref:DNA topoisomerase I n=1 Tax=Hydnum rufescens UP504 TaxID=1448309 RepID=A0A9P6DH82_9AGAM|nr:hypothetical protein BS47DRAFT_1445884 [Hydnum rufescens UP504]